MLQKEERTCGAADVRTVLQARYILTANTRTPKKCTYASFSDAEEASEKAFPWFES